LQNTIFSYTDKEHSALVKIDNFKVELPNNGAQLYCWADDLHNCLASYLDNIKEKSTIVYGFFKGTKIQFAVEIMNNEIMQSYRSYNRSLLPDEEIILLHWFKNVYLNNHNQN